ncbi:hypothetical protein F7Q99_08815 [Streptomyces kaniharaensis]|uniref:Uncharacterized protein n=1 Tax=Streptomyces kaniharaensis TaxID=212423 RepID=A0A6N7KNS1_9ACTN|nr:DUF6412 domain-containing protein [Streptomyces kaniharaensis]MQS12385.1 hypothetical protein [Streptomyces kaniharaensis]
MAVVAMLLGLLRVLTGEMSAEGGTLASAAAVAAVVLLAGAVAGTLAGARLLGARAPAAVRDGVLRRRAFRTAFLSQRDPDARGRRRPRAPGAAQAAA